MSPSQKIVCESKILRETSLANTSDEFEILQKKKEFWLKIQLQLTSELQLIPITYSKVTSCLSLIGMNYQSNKNAYLN